MCRPLSSGALSALESAENSVPRTAQERNEVRNLQRISSLVYFEKVPLDTPELNTRLHATDLDFVRKNSAKLTKLIKQWKREGSTGIARLEFGCGIEALFCKNST